MGAMLNGHHHNQTMKDTTRSEETRNGSEVHFVFFLCFLMIIYSYATCTTTKPPWASTRRLSQQAMWRALQGPKRRFPRFFIFYFIYLLDFKDDAEVPQANHWHGF